MSDKLTQQWMMETPQPDLFKRFLRLAQPEEVQQLSLRLLLMALNISFALATRIILPALEMPA